MVDTSLAGVGLFGSISLLGLLEPHVGALFAPPMLASGIVFFISAEPPHPKGFLSGTVCSATISFGVLSLLSPHVCVASAHGGAAASLLMWYKVTGSIFPPAGVLAGLLLSTSAASGSLLATAGYLAQPWLAGHMILYGGALATSALRSRVRVGLTKAALRAHDDGALLQIFRKFDTSGDSTLDASELKVALRVALGVDMPMADCVALLAAADANGTDTVDFDEFRAICRGQL